MTNFEYYKTLEASVNAYNNEKEPLYNVHEGVSAGRFLTWLYKDHTITLFDTAKTIVSEVCKYGITCDTMASERLYKFCMALKESGDEENVKHAKQIEELDRKGCGRRNAIAYVLLLIGKMFTNEALFENASEWNMY